MQKPRIKVFIATYNRNQELKKCIDSLLDSDIGDFEYSITILNNYSKISLDPQYIELGVKVLNNETRPDFSNGHLSRTWNQAILLGFVDLKDPDADFVITMQDDVEVVENCFKQLMIYHESYNFISVGTGDDFMSFTPEAVKKVGLFDERFCGIGFQHEEYFMRQVAFNRKMSSINDFYHNTLHNQIYPPRINALKEWHGDEEMTNSADFIYYNGHNDIIKFKTCGFVNGDTDHMSALKYHSYVSEFMRSKWQIDDVDILNMYTRNCIPGTIVSSIDGAAVCKISDKIYRWNSFRNRGDFVPFTPGPFEDFLGDPYGVTARAVSREGGFVCKNPQPILYPYFELDIENRDKIGYSQ